MLQHSLSVLPRLGFHFKTFSSKAIPNCSMQSMPTLRALYLKSFCSKSTVQCSPPFYSEHAHFESFLLLCWNRSHLPLHLCLLLLCRLSRLGWKEKVFLVLLSMSMYREDIETKNRVNMENLKNFFFQGPLNLHQDQNGNLQIGLAQPLVTKPSKKWRDVFSLSSQLLTYLLLYLGHNLHFQGFSHPSIHPCLSLSHNHRLGPCCGGCLWWHK